jgi:hypothetical protein
MPNYAKMEKDPPKIFNSDYFSSWDQAMQQLAIANWVISKCEKCGMPVEAMRAECDGLCSFFAGLNAEWRGPQAQAPEVLKS